MLAAIALMPAMLYLCIRDMRRVFPVWTRSLLWSSIIIFITDIVLWLIEAWSTWLYIDIVFATSWYLVWSEKRRMRGHSEEQMVTKDKAG